MNEFNVVEHRKLQSGKWLQTVVDSKLNKYDAEGACQDLMFKAADVSVGWANIYYTVGFPFNRIKG